MSNMVKKALFGLSSLLFTIFVFLNTYEVLANTDIPFANSIREMSDQSLLNKIIKDFETKPSNSNQSPVNRLDSLDYLEIPSFGVQIYLEEARKINNLWYQRPSLGDYVELNKDVFGNAVDYLIYTDKSWKSIPYCDEIEIGTEIKVYTHKGFSSLYEVSEKRMVSFGKSFIASKNENRQIILLIEDTESQRYCGMSIIVKK